MKLPRLLSILGGTSVLIFAGLLAGQSADTQLTVSHAECSYFGSQRERYVSDALARSRGSHALTARTEQALALMAMPARPRLPSKILRRNAWASTSRPIPTSRCFP